jgi:hypothetical protein
MNSGLDKSTSPPEQSSIKLWQLKIDAEIDEVIQIIRALGRESGFSPRPIRPSSDWFAKSRARLARARWMRLAKTRILPVAIAAVAGFLAGYNSRAPKHSVEVIVARRAIPIEPEIRRAIPVKVEIRRAISVRAREWRASK